MGDRLVMDVVYRQYEDADAVGVQQLLQELGYSLSILELCDNLKAIEEQGGTVIVAVRGERVIGSVCAIIDVRLAEGICGEIVSLAVSESCRRHGIGNILVQNAEAWLSARTGKIRVRANVVRDGAHAFYRRQGYREIKEQKIFVKQL